ncbi:MAG: ABC transporter ATP-binding protein [Luteolibacter sp.]
MNPLVEFQNVDCRFGRAWALRQASFRIPAGSITALLGPNGAGKSTALKIALNLVRPSAGNAQVLGVDSRRVGPSQLERIGYVADGMDLPMWMTVDGFLNWCRPLYPKWDLDLERSLRKQFDLPGDRQLKHLSRGQRMKAALVSSLAYRPELLVLDEPFSGLDPLVRDEFINGLLELADTEQFTVIVSSHDIDEVHRLADHVIALNEGSVMLDESTETLLSRHRQVEILLPADFGTLPTFPSHWIGAVSSGRVLRFTDTDYDPERFSHSAGRLFPECPAPDVRSFTLRELFVTLIAAGKAAL